MKFSFVFSSIVLFIIFFSACQNNKENSVDKKSELSASTKKPSIEIIDPWIRPAAAEANTALFFIIQNNSDTDDTLLYAASEIARKVELHETYKAENNMMGMRHINYVAIPKNDTVIFKPRDLHVMLMKLYDDLSIGDTGTIVLTFKNAGNISINAIVRDMPIMK